MNTPPCQPSLLTRRFRKESAAALVVMLIFLVLIAIMIVAMSDSLRVERVAASSYTDRTRASQMAERGIEHVVATLSKETADINRNWISQPGQLILGAERDNPGTPADERKVLLGAVVGGTDAKIVLLHSGTASTALLSNTNTVLQPPNLNISISSATGEHLITEKTDPVTTRAVTMRLKWIYVRKDATLDTSETPNMKDAANPIIGRYAFWTDDESGKVNINLAWSRDNPANTLSPASPTRLSLAALFPENAEDAEEEATAFHNTITTDNYTTLQRLFNSPDQVREVPNSAYIRGVNKFDTTHYNHDPDTTFFNEPRIVLTTQKKMAGGKPFLDILTDDNTDPGLYANLSEAKINTTIALLRTYLQRTDWPMIAPSTSSFQSKYFGSDASRLVQLAIGIIEYVRSVESPQKFVEPMRLQANTSGGYNLRNTAGSDDTFFGNPRRFYITEMAVWRAAKLETTGTNAGPNAGRLKTRFYIELHLPDNYGIPQVDLLDPVPGSGKKLFTYIQAAINPGAAFNADGTDAYTANGSFFYEVTASNIVGGEANRILSPGGYRVLVYQFWLNPAMMAVSTDGRYPYKADPSGTINDKLVKFTLRYALALATSPTDAGTALRLEVVPLGLPPAPPDWIGAAPLIVSSPATVAEPPSITDMPGDLIGSVESNDPRVNALAGDWAAQESHSLGKKNLGNSIGAPASTAATAPQPDMDSSGKYSMASFRMPAPKGDPSNPDGLVRSPGELGFVHTGLEGKSGGDPNKAGTPWRTLRLQPNLYTDTTVVPDWALMDLFTVPSVVPAAAATLFSPYGTAVAGRVNINAANAEPFGLQHTAALEAVLLNARTSTIDPTAKLTATDAKAIAAAIAQGTLAPAKMNSKNKLIWNGKQYGYTAGYDSPGEVTEIKGVADGGEESEELVRSISNLLTTRGDVFSIYTIGQSIKQTPAGKLVVTGEQRQQAMVERYLNSSNKVNFRSVYLRNINP